VCEPLLSYEKLNLRKRNEYMKYSSMVISKIIVLTCSLDAKEVQFSSKSMAYKFKPRVFQMLATIVDMIPL
jgi:hypothetical protein